MRSIPIPVFPEAVIKRFWSKVEIKSPEECWNWTGITSKKGYGRFQYGRRTYTCHRVSKNLVEPIPEGLVMDHLCRNRRCVNPSHLEAVTEKENVLRMARRVTHCPKGHPYHGWNLRTNEKGHRLCRTCINERRRKHRARIAAHRARGAAGGKK